MWIMGLLVLVVGKSIIMIRLGFSGIYSYAIAGVGV